MLILTAPAKTLDWKTDYPNLHLSEPQFLEETEELHTLLQSQTPKQLEKTLGVSAKLASLNYQRFQDWVPEHSPRNSRPALYTFRGDVFQQMPVSTYDEDQVTYLQKSLRIASGYYGVLRAMDLMQPYRLEMHVNLKSIGPLADYWREQVTASLNADIKKEGHTFLLNLASKEYSAAIDRDLLNVPVIDVDFKQVRNGQLKTFGMLAKRARGMMIHHCAQVQAETIDDVKTFSANGYKLEAENEKELLFLCDEKMHR